MAVSKPDMQHVTDRFYIIPMTSMSGLKQEYTTR